MARPSKLSPAVTDRIVALLRAGNRRGAAARAAGLSEPTFHRWMADGRPAFRSFREAVERAEGEAETTVVATLINSMPRNAAAAMWWLENRSPEWRNRRQPPPMANPEKELAHTARDTTRVIVVTQEQLEAIAAQRLRAINPALAEMDDDQREATRRRLVIEG